MQICLSSPAISRTESSWRTSPSTRLSKSPWSTLIWPASSKTFARFSIRSDAQVKSLSKEENRKNIVGRCFLIIVSLQKRRPGWGDDEVVLRLHLRDRRAVRHHPYLHQLLLHWQVWTITIVTIITITRPKPARGRHGLAGGISGQDTVEAVIFWGLFPILTSYSVGINKDKKHLHSASTLQDLVGIMSSCALGRQCWTRLEAWQVFCPLRSLEEDQALRRDPIRVKEVQHLMKLLKPARSMASAQRSPLWHLAHKYKVSAYLSPNDVFGPKNCHLPAFGSGGCFGVHTQIFSQIR